MSWLAEILLLILCGFGAGIVGGLLTHWTLLRFLRELEYRLGDVESRVTREVKIRASEKSREGKGSDAKLEEWAAQQQPVKAPNFLDWRKSKMTGG